MPSHAVGSLWARPRNARQRLHELRKGRTPRAVARGGGEDDRQFQGLGRLASATTLCFNSPVE